MQDVLPHVVKNDADTWVDAQTEGVRIRQLVHLISAARPNVPITHCAANLIAALERRADRLQLYRVRPGHYAQAIGWTLDVVRPRPAQPVYRCDIVSAEWVEEFTWRAVQPASASPGKPPAPATWCALMRRRWVDAYRPGALDDRELCGLVLTKAVAQQLLRELLPDQVEAPLQLVAREPIDERFAEQWDTLAGKQAGRWTKAEKAAVRYLVEAGGYGVAAVAKRMGLSRQAVEKAVFADDVPVGSTVARPRR